jgi:hypothetical protein
MIRSIAIVMLAVLTTVCSASDATRAEPRMNADSVLALAHVDRTPAFLNIPGAEEPTASPAQQACCKICQRGKACGNTCISRDKQCHVGPGCACDG